MEMDLPTCRRARVARDARFDGRFFIGVTSTGVYCRPVCPVKSPKERNVRYFPSAAAAADAGFRPCLRCRPEASPGTPAWNGTSSTVARALRLIGDGVLQDASLPELAGRLGVGERHLRRLFLAHLGASPVSVEATRRLHAAKRLLDETDLPLTRIALAAGYGSVRRFNAAFRGAYGRAPRELRGRRRVEASTGEYTFRLAYRPPYDWEGLLGFLAGRAVPGVEAVRDGAYERTIRLDGHAGRLSVRPASAALKAPGGAGNAADAAALKAPGGAGNAADAAALKAPGGALVARIRLSEPALLAKAVARVRRMLDLDADPAPIAAHLARDPLLAPLVTRHAGIRVPGCWDPFELAVRAVLGQQVSVKGARTLAARLVARHGERLEDGDPGVLFPRPEAIADGSLDGLGLIGARVRTLRALAAAVASGALSFEAPADEVAARLQELPGIGAWTAEYVAMRGLSEPDAFPATDLVLRRAAEGQDVEAWRPWRAYAAMLLWRAA